ncbi:hypothetical protein REPUB_Repub07fG0039200 [Reevesia pubescens]
MFKNTFQSGFLSILYSLGSKPLQIWDKEVVNGHVKRPHDDDIQSNVLEIIGSNIQSTYITCPADPAATLGIKLPFLVMIVKNLKKYFSFEIQILDDKNVRRRFRASNFQAVTRVKPYICTMPLRLDEGWNQIQLNLADYTRRAYGTNYVETLRVQVHANCRLRRIYFSDRLYSEEELPPEFKLYLPMQQILPQHIATRFKDIALHADPRTRPHELCLLSDEDSWKLLSKKICLEWNGMTSLPAWTEELGKQIVKKCGGLPPAIVVLGDFEISARRLILLWVAEGFVQPRGQEPLEDVAEDYLVELVGRSMVQIAAKKLNGSIKTIRINDLLREFAIKKAKEDRVFDTIHGDAKDCFLTRP